LPDNRNPWVPELLAWHGHDRGGVRVPFRDGDGPLSQTLSTPVVEKVRGLARDLAAGMASPRWIFLVGGPGNGKSEAVQAFLAELDSALGAGGGLVGFIAARFSASGPVPRRVDVAGTDFLPAAARFDAQINRLIVVQDASATESETGNAAEALCTDVQEVLADPGALPPVFISCVNRGLLARALRVAQATTYPPEVRELLGRVSEATAITQAALRLVLHPAWPTVDQRVACWPLDTESLFDQSGASGALGDQILQIASRDGKWEVPENCSDCDSRLLCPFRQNASWLREEGTRAALVRLLRRAELATGRRLTFRDSLSMAPNLMIGEWTDFGPAEHPCDWVRDRVEIISDSAAQPDPKAKAASDLTQRLFPLALFPGFQLEDASTGALKLAEAHQRVITQAVAGNLPAPDASGANYLRTVVIPQLAPLLDPASESPADPESRLRRIEDDYSHSVHQGNSRYGGSLSPLEQGYLNLLAEAEAEWTNLDEVEYKQVLDLQRFLRALASILVKRSIGVRECRHANEGMLAEYQEQLRSPDLLARVIDPLLEILGGDRFRFGPTESFGRPLRSGDWAVLLEADAPGVNIVPAPSATRSTPGHDLPILKVEQWTLPLTFDLFMALRLRAQGCANSSLPASIRASIDRMRHLQAGKLCRDRSLLSNGRAKYRLQALPWAIALDSTGNVPRASPQPRRPGE
jgi:hypothetical protein